ncbi:MAG TPA: M23 family metallopeptidase [Vicinamibacterales bacterium]|jgi:hypothetical protein
MKSMLAGAASLIATALVVPLISQAPRVFPSIDVRAPVQPHPFVASGVTYLVYELHITNLSSRVTTIDGLEVRERSSLDAPPLLRLEKDALEAALYRPGAPPDDAEKKTLPAGRTAIAFIWIPLHSRNVPAALTHRFDVHVAGPSATDDAAFSINGVEIPVSPKTPPILGPPLEGDLWLAANGPDNGVGHRRTLLAFAGEARIAQRFATDWVRLFDDGRTFRGDPRDNASYRAFGARVLAVADGTVVDTVDGVPENVPDPVARAVPITPDTLGGNDIVLDLGNGTYATYAHLQPGSLKVKKGDRVRKGQPLALLGNTGNSSEPHLHFQVADGRKAFDAEGIPFVFASFDLEAEPAQVTPAIREVGGSFGIDPARLATWLRAPAQRREKELPLLNAIVKFAAPSSGR